jgi:Glycoside Hydrolase Family 113
MSGWRRLAACAAAVAIAVAGCDGAAHIKAVEPPAVRDGARILTPAGLASLAGFQRGIGLDVYTWPGEDFAAAATDTIRYVVSLRANAISVSFPFFMDGTRSGSVHATDRTPTPAQLAALISAARQAGLRVSLRPLLDEASLGRARVRWRPSDEAAWFRSYERFLKPYAQLAQRDGVSELIVGTELGGFGTSPRWNGLNRFVRRWYSGTLACSDNWDAVVVHGCGSAAVQAVDAYPPSRSAARFTATWLSFDRALPKGTVETEVSIAAATRAWRKPWELSWPVSRVDPSVQAHWFADACRAAVTTHLGGIYFWGATVGTRVPDGPTLASQTTWAGGPAARALSSCFASIERTGT